jgi:hypothetical protein
MAHDMLHTETGFPSDLKKPGFVVVQPACRAREPTVGPVGRREEALVKLFAKGSRVTQVTYGAGTVTSSDERYTVIEFDQHGRRVFLTDMVALAKTDEPAPSKPVKEKRKKASKATS